MSIDSINYEELAESRITQQHRNKEKFVALTRGICGLVEQYIEDPASNLYDKLDIDKMGGANLDVIGEIVGQDRVVIDYDLVEFFGYDGAAGAGAYGSVNDSTVGARYRSLSESETGGLTKLEDPEYRTFIKARILKNYSTSTPEEIRDSVKIITGTDQVQIGEGVMTMQIGVLGGVDQTTANIIQNYDILPRPTGVEITDVYDYGLLGFNGASTRVSYPSESAYDLDANDFVIKLSIIAESYAGTFYNPLYFQTDFVSGVQLYLDYDRIAFEDISSAGLYSGTSTIELNRKYRIRVEKTGTNISIYVDDKLEVSDVISADVGSSHFVIIGENLDNNFDGIISDFCLINGGATAIDSPFYEGSGTSATNNGTGSAGIIANPDWRNSL
jgi:hypothetical protein